VPRSKVVPQLFLRSFILIAFIDLEDGKLTKANVNRAIRAVAKWKECAELLRTPKDIQETHGMLAELESTLEGLGANLGKRAKREKVAKPKSLSLLHLILFL